MKRVILRKDSDR